MFTVRHRFHHPRGALAFTLRGSKRETKRFSLDLWTGEGWIFEIQPDGSVKEGYDHPNSPLREIERD